MPPPPLIPARNGADNEVIKKYIH
jgi:hypothetical protein